MKDPAFLFYTGDFVSGTLTMTNEEVGAYIRLLCVQHNKGFVTERDINSICQDIDISEIKYKFLYDDEKGHYYNERLREEVEKRKAYSESRKKNRGGNNDKLITYIKHMLNICKSYEVHMENENEIINTVINIDGIKKIFNSNKTKFKKIVVETVNKVIPEWDWSEADIFNFKKSLLDLGVNEKYVNDWMLVRKDKKAANTETAFNGFVNKVKDAGLTINDAVKICAENSWVGFNKKWLENITPQKPLKPKYIKFKEEGRVRVEPEQKALNLQRQLGKYFEFMYYCNSLGEKVNGN